MNKVFWINRIKQFGHTGWSDRLTYMYDQKIRLKIIETIIAKYFNNKIDRVLDFGCGSGDFSSLLAEYSKKVISVDIAKEIVDIAKSKNNKPNIHFNILDEVELEEEKFELVLSITVLQHITNDKELENTLNLFNSILKKNGMLVLIESFSGNQDSNYLKFRSYKKVKDLLENNNFKILEMHNLYHPQKHPTKLSKLFKNSILIRILNKLKIDKILMLIVNVFVKYDNPLILEDSLTKLVIAKKIK